MFHVTTIFKKFANVRIFPCLSYTWSGKNRTEHQVLHVSLSLDGSHKIKCWIFEKKKKVDIFYIFDIFYKDIKWYFIIILYLSLKISMVKPKRFCICTKKPYSPVTGKYQQKTIDYRSIFEAITDSYLTDLFVKPAICCLQYFVKKAKKVKFRG